MSSPGSGPKSGKEGVDTEEVAQDVARALVVAIPADQQPVGARSERVRGGSRTPSVSSRASIRSLPEEPVIEGEGQRRQEPVAEATEGTSKSVVVEGSETSPPAKRTRSHDREEDAAQRQDDLNQCFVAGGDEDLDLEDDEEEEETPRRVVSRSRFKTPVTVRKRVAAAREKFLRCEESEVRAAALELFEAKADEHRSNLSVVRSELTSFKRETLGRLASMQTMLEEIKGLASTAAADRNLGSLKTDWEEQLRLPWTKEEDLEYVENSPQLRRTLSEYAVRFVELAPSVVRDYVNKLFTRELSGHYLQPGSTAHVVWGLAYKPLPAFVLATFRHLVDSKPVLAGQGGALRANLVHLFSKRRGDRRDGQQDWLVIQATGRADSGEDLKSAARIILIDGRENFHLVDEPLDYSTVESTKAFVNKFGRKVLDKLRSLYPVPAEFDAAVVAAVAPFPRDRRNE
jgi:hypothetical protein